MIYRTILPLHCEQSTCTALPTPKPTPLFPNSAEFALESMQRSKLRFAPYWFVPERPDCEHSGFPDAGHRLVTMTTMLLPALLTWRPELSFWIVSFQHVPQPGPAPAPC